MDELPQAFPLRQKKGKPKKSPRYLTWIRGKRCLLCSVWYPIEAAHIRMSDFRFEKEAAGKGEKSDDKWAIPLCAPCHRAQHERSDERKFWEEMKIDVVARADQLWREYNGESVPNQDFDRVSAR